VRRRRRPDRPHHPAGAAAGRPGHLRARRPLPAVPAGAFQPKGLPMTDTHLPPAPAPGHVEHAAPRLVAEHISLGYGERLIVDDLNLSIPTGVVTTVIGPNGCGKSTLLRALSRLLKPRTGTVLLDGHDITTMRTREVARVLGMLPQAPVAPEGLTVADLVSRGRHP